jgi:hypothetical protein
MWGGRCPICDKLIQFLFGLFVVSISGIEVAAQSVSPTPPSQRGDAEVLADRPLAVWGLEDQAGSNRAVAERFATHAGATPANDLPNEEMLLADAERLVSTVSGSVVFGEAGPRPPRYPGFVSGNHAALFGNGRGYLKLTEATPEFTEFQFTAGDAITLEAWVNAFGMTEGQQVYIIGKGRTGRPGFTKENQNWSLRLASRGGLARPSFLFREAAERVDLNKHHHRWIASEGFEPGTGWHHVAISYTFGEKDSLRGYVDGRPVTGTWDLGGATAAPPVVDDDEVWI